MSRSHRRRILVLPVVALLLGAPAAPATALAATIATDDAYLVAEDQVLTVDALAGLLANDTSDGPALCLTQVSDSLLEGTVEAAADGSFSYTPDPDWNGVTSFTYGVRAGEGECVGDPEDEGTVTITVSPVNDAPTARADSFTALRDRTIGIVGPGVLANDSDVDGDALTAIKVSEPAHGVVTLGSDGGFSYTPAAGYVGPDGFSYRASDGSLTSPTRVVTITVTALPTAAPSVAPTASPTVAPTPTAEPPPTASPEPSASGDPFPSVSPAPSFGPSASPASSLATEEPVAGDGGLPMPVIGLGLLLLALLTFGGAFLVPKWLERRRVGEPPLD